ncbi:MAG: hypothetical protein K8W52_45785 [Deltaproteobacteria bacterium]|nr:hypothetical protein [Deltaproteobacteria bacterium]
MNANLLRLALLVAITSVPALAAADEPAPPRPRVAQTRYPTRASVMMGLNQWVLFGGGNVAAQVAHGRWVVEYSHGQALDFGKIGAIALTSAERDAGVNVEQRWTTGGGFGFRITPNLHVLVELKLHHYEITGADANQRAGYTSFTVGPGVFYDLYLYKGLFIQPSLRWWPTVASSYTATAFTRDDGTVYQHARHELPPFVNVNVGYTFGR